MIAYLKTADLAKPRVISAPPSGSEEGVGYIVPNFEIGSLFLQDARGKYLRLAWTDADSPRRRAVPAGTYSLTGYRVRRTDQAGREWFLSSTSTGIRDLDVAVGQEQTVAVAQTITMNCHIAKKPTSLDVRMMITGEPHAGLSIYQDGKRIAISYAVQDATGRTIRTGPMSYG